MYPHVRKPSCRLISTSTPRIPPYHTCRRNASVMRASRDITKPVVKATLLVESLDTWRERMQDKNCRTRSGSRTSMCGLAREKRLVVVEDEEEEAGYQPRTRSDARPSRTNTRGIPHDFPVLLRHTTLLDPSHGHTTSAIRHHTP